MVSRLNIPAARRALTLAPEAALSLVEEEALALNERRERRQVKGVGSARPRCQSCQKFMKSDARPCSSCGYMKDVGWAA